MSIHKTVALTQDQKTDVANWLSKLPAMVRNLVKGVEFVEDTSHDPILGDKIVAGFDPGSGVISLTPLSWSADNLYHEAAHALLNSYVNKEDFSVMQRFSNEFEVRGESFRGYPSIYQGLIDLKNEFDNLKASNPDWSALDIESYMYNENEGFYNYTEAFCDRFADYVSGKGAADFNQFFSKLFGGELHPSTKDAGKSIAEQLGNGVVLNGPQYENEKLAGYMFTDTVTGSTFMCSDLNECKGSLIKLRQSFKKEIPTWQLSEKEYLKLLKEWREKNPWPAKKSILDDSLREQGFNIPVPVENEEEEEEDMEEEMQPKVIAQYPISRVPKNIEKGPPKLPVPPVKGSGESTKIAFHPESETIRRLEEEIARKKGIAMNKSLPINSLPANACIRTDPRYDKAVRHLGYESVDISPENYGNLRKDTEIVEQSQINLSKVQVIPDEQLSSRQLASLKLIRAIVNYHLHNWPDDYKVKGVYAAIIPPASDLTRTTGLYSRSAQEIYIPADQLEYAHTAVDVDIHELAHHVSQAEDLEEKHVSTISELAGQVVKYVWDKRFDPIIRDPNFVW
jgi:hypothetical protein